MRAFTLMQTFTFRELDAIRGALLDDITRRYQPIDTESMEETHHEKVPCNVYALAPLYIRATNKE